MITTGNTRLIMTIRLTLSGPLKRGMVRFSPGGPRLNPGTIRGLIHAKARGRPDYMNIPASWILHSPIKGRTCDIHLRCQSHDVPVLTDVFREGRLGDTEFKGAVMGTVEK